MLYGIDYIGGVNYIETIVRAHPSDFAAGFLCRATGWKNGIEAARALAASGNCTTMRIHGLWLDSHSFNEDNIPQAVKQAQKVAELATDFPDLTLYYSPWLEHRAPRWLFQDCRKACREVLPKRVKIVSSGTVMPKGFAEVHHSPPVRHPYIFSFDGVDMRGENLNAWKHIQQDSEIFFGWIPECNGKKNVEDNTPRSDRTEWLKPAHIKAMAVALRDRV